MTTADLYRVAIVGASSLKGKELKDLLGERNFPAYDIRLLDEDESQGQLEQVAEDITFVLRVHPEQFQNVDFAFFAGDERLMREHWKEARDAGAAIVDLSYALEDEPGINIRAPWIERELARFGFGETTPDLQSDAVVIAHPAAIVLGLLLLRAHKLAPVARTIVNIFEPVSERGKRGMDELHQQTINLLSFQQLPKKVFDAQVAFNMLARYGEKPALALEVVERRILRHLKLITRDRVPMPSLVLSHAPIFHAHVFSIYIELEKHMSTGDFAQTLSGEHVELSRMVSEEDSPSNVNAAGQDNILLAVRRDGVHENGFWLWAAVDNLKLAALTAVDCAAALALVRSKGSVQ